MPKSLPHDVAIVGVGMSKFGAFPDRTSRDLFVEAFKELRGPRTRASTRTAIEALYLGNYSSDLFEGQGHIAPIMADAVGLCPVPAVRVEDACASGGVALRQGVMAVASGMYDVVLVGGVERMTKLPTAQVTDTLGSAADTLYEIPAGFTFPGFYAAIATAYMHKYGMKPEHLMNVAIKNHENGALNPKAQFGVTIPDWMQGRIAAAIKKGKPAPTWRDAVGFPPRRRGQPDGRLAAAAVRLLAGHRRRGVRAAGERQSAHASSPTIRSTSSARARHPTRRCTTGPT